MTCPGDNTTGARTVPWVFRNWAGTRSFLVPMLVSPTTRQQLVAAIQEVEKTGGSIKAVGSAWSYSDAAVDESVTHVIDTSHLMRQISGASNVIPSALLPALQPSRGANPARHFVHIEAGITIHDLNFLLDDAGLALPTMGGSNGQSLAGAISTGVHGSDFNLPPIADCVRAIHLVGPGGQEWWIESATNRITDHTAIQAIAADPNGTLLCSDIRITYDDNLYRAALVSLGRMGVIYSVVIEVVPAFKLAETRAASQWEGPNGEAAWISSLATSQNKILGRYREIIIDPYSRDILDPNQPATHDCVVTSRINTLPTATVTPQKPLDAGTGLYKLACAQQDLNIFLTATITEVSALIAVATATAIASLSWLAAIPFVGALLFSLAVTGAITTATTALVALQTALITALNVPGQGLADKLVSICNLATLAGYPQLVPRLVGFLMTNQRPVTPPGVPDVNDGFRLMTSQWDASGHARDPDPPCTRSVDGFEFAFPLDANGTHLSNFLNFVTDVFALTNKYLLKNTPVGFGMSVRITRKTQALIGMQQTDHTAHVEFDFVRGLIGQSNFYGELQTAVANRGGAPHWGLMHTVDGTRVAAIYGQNLVTWQQELNRIIVGGGGSAETFRTTFSLIRQLEPVSGTHSLPGASGFGRKLQGLIMRAKGFHSAFPW